MSESPAQHGKVALVTAAGAGIGQAIAEEWCRRGGQAVVSDVDAGAAEHVARLVAAAGRRAIARRVDVGNEVDVRDAVDAACLTFGGLDVLFNVAGVNLPKSVDQISESEWARILDTNLTSVYRCSKFAIPRMRERGGGAIVNVSSTAGILAENRCSAYSASKGAVILLTRNMALDYARDNIRVNALCPGGTMTPRVRAYLDRNPGHETMMDSLAPMKRFARPEEIAKPAVFLASDDASFITGATLVVDGGMTAGTYFPLFEAMS